MRRLRIFSSGALNELLAREKARGGFYKGLPERLGSLDELGALPFTTPEQLAEKRAGAAADLAGRGEPNHLRRDERHDRAV